MTKRKGRGKGTLDFEEEEGGVVAADVVHAGRAEAVAMDCEHEVRADDGDAIAVPRRAKSGVKLLGSGRAPKVANTKCKFRHTRAPPSIYEFFSPCVFLFTRHFFSSIFSLFPFYFTLNTFFLYTILPCPPFVACFLAVRAEECCCALPSRSLGFWGSADKMQKRSCPVTCLSPPRASWRMGGRSLYRASWRPRRP